jgi:hypothetical protein
MNVVVAPVPVLRTSRAARGVSHRVRLRGASHRLATLAFAASALAGWAAPTLAHACGGTWCDAVTNMPVDQTGENILFARRDGVVETHVQIQYQGDAEQFAWVVPVQAIPGISTGSDALFQALLSSTTPSFSVTQMFEDCGTRELQFGCVSEDEVGSLAGGGSWDSTSAGEGGEDPDVVARGVVGSFEYAILDGGTVEGVTAWLTDEGYAQDDEAAPILAEYLAEGFAFVAIKLRGGAQVDEIHPIVFTIPGDEPCVPIRLTRIAATADMGIRVFALGDSQAAPMNYASVVPNWAKLDWTNVAASYEQLIAMAVDQPGADGRAFVTEFAGSTSSVGLQGATFENSAWSPALLRATTPDSVIAALDNQQLLRCDAGQCQAFHPLIMGALRRVLPAPEGVDEGAFWSCVECYPGLVDASAWSADALADDVEGRIVVPARNADALLASTSYLTRMYTTMSPNEMTVDPIFEWNPDLLDVSNVHVATRVTTCEGDIEYTIDELGADMPPVLLDPADVSWPRLDDAPWALRIEQPGPTGAPMPVADFSAETEAAIAAWRREVDIAEDGGCSVDPTRFGGALWLLAIVGVAARGRRRRSAA